MGSGIAIGILQKELLIGVELAEPDIRRLGNIDRIEIELKAIVKTFDILELVAYSIHNLVDLQRFPIYSDAFYATLTIGMACFGLLGVGDGQAHDGFAVFLNPVHRIAITIFLGSIILIGEAGIHVISAILAADSYRIVFAIAYSNRYSTIVENRTERFFLFLVAAVHQDIFVIVLRTGTIGVSNILILLESLLDILDVLTCLSRS